VISAARKYLAELERRSANTHAPQLQQELLLTVPVATAPHPLAEALDELDPDSLSPREALEALYRLKRLATSD
jgi:DNA mismatch repair protein MutS